MFKLTIYSFVVYLFLITGNVINAQNHSTLPGCNGCEMPSAEEMQKMINELEPFVELNPCFAG